MTLPPNELLALSNVIAAFVPEELSKVDAFVTLIAAVLVIALFEVIERVFEMVDAPIAVAAFSVTATVAPVSSRVPNVPSPSSNVILPAPALSVVVLVIAIVPESSMLLPELLRERVLLTVEAPISIAAFSVMATVAPVSSRVPNVPAP